MTTLEETFAEFGIRTTTEEFERLVAEAVRDLYAGWRPQDPLTTLTLPEIEVLRAGGLPLGQADGDRANRALVRSAAQYQALLSTSLSVGRVAEMLGVDASRIRHRLAERSIFGIRLRSGWYIPDFQFEGDRLLPGIDTVLMSLPSDLHPLEVVGWFTTPDPDLVVKGCAVTPREWLRLGKDPGELADLAASLDEDM